MAVGQSRSNFKLIKEEYLNQVKIWPQTGKHILAHYDSDTVVVYQAYKPKIAEYAVKYQTFGGPDFSFDRMSWIKTNFMWMMYRCGWAQKRDQEHVLAIWLTRNGFDEILAKARTGKEAGGKADEVRLQWDPDHDPHGEKLSRRAIQLGLRGAGLQMYAKQHVVQIEDITDFVTEQFQTLSTNKNYAGLFSPKERVYSPDNENTCAQLGLDFLSQQTVVGFTS